MMRYMDEDMHFKYFRMDKARFNQLLNRITVKIFHKDIHKFPVSLEGHSAVT